MFLITIPFLGTVNAANITKINDIINNMSEFDGKTVTIEGEAIGEVMNRGAYSWLNINDGTNAIGVYLKSSQAERIKTFGDYKHVGDTVHISGLFSKNSVVHGGDVVIDCSSLEIVHRGSVVEEHIPTTKVAIAALLLFTGFILTYRYFHIMKKKENASF